MRAKRMYLGIAFFGLGLGAVGAQMAGADVDRVRRDLATQESRVSPRLATKALEREQLESVVEFARKIGGGSTPSPEVTGRFCLVP